jgi:hypothetical protein
MEKMNAKKIDPASLFLRKMVCVPIFRVTRRKRHGQVSDSIP